MKTYVAVVALILALASNATPAAHGAPGGGGGMHGGHGAPPGGWHGGWHGGWGHGGWWGRRSFFFVGPSIVYSPFYWDYWGYPYGYPYGYPGAYPYGWLPPAYAWGSPPIDQPTSEAPPPPSSEAPPEAPSQAPAPPEGPPPTYGLVQLRGVPDGSRIDLDGRFWMQANGLDDRWLALPRGPHTLDVTAPGHDVVSRQVDVSDGKAVVLRFNELRSGRAR